MSEKSNSEEIINYLYNCDFFDDKFDEDEKRLDSATEIIEEAPLDFFELSFEWMKKNCSVADQYINFAYLYYYYGGTDFEVKNPYPFLAILYNGIDWEHDNKNAKEADNIFWSIATNMLEKANLLHGYTDEYDPFEDSRLITERKLVDKK